MVPLIGAVSIGGKFSSRRRVSILGGRGGHGVLGQVIAALRGPGLSVPLIWIVLFLWGRRGRSCVLTILIHILHLHHLPVRLPSRCVGAAGTVLRGAQFCRCRRIPH
ncbi:hypothetical protein GDO81_027782 [Engystomops pustulosus]|uniref:Uncharacterized protein n=1 Tax=Engystomops pustulosus TaxID=76066 RepID=A0AAV6YF08_ENGPU|nr:hypothetical protein GDO81_027782 [Engystomops pustulosus]